MKLEDWALIQDIVKAGGIYVRDMKCYMVEDNLGRLHRTDGPALVTLSGAYWYYSNGVFHREDGPAILNEEGTQIWYRKGKKHRVGEPAVIYKSGYAEFWEDGAFQRWI